jgi:hypothetical protein
MSVADAKFIEWLDEDPKRGKFDLDDPALRKLKRDGRIELRDGLWRPTKLGLATASGVMMLMRGNA